MVCHALLQGTFLTQGSNRHLLRWRQILYPLSHLRSSETFLGDPKPKGKLFWLDLHGLAIDKLGRLHDVKWWVEMFSTSSSMKVRHIQFKREVYNFNHSVLQANIICHGRPRKWILRFFQLKVLKRPFCMMHCRSALEGVCVCVCVGGWVLCADGSVTSALDDLYLGWWPTII